MFVARDCYNSSGGSLNNNDPWLILPDFPISSAKNKFIAVGCDTYATFSGSTYVTGCLSSCGNISDVINGSCSGIGCCETSIPRDAYRYNISVTSYNNHVGIWEFNPCGYAFVAEDGFSFSKDNLHELPFDMVPIVVDWLIPDQTCDDAKKNTTTYMCQENSICTDAENGNGYQCRCSEGFQGKFPISKMVVKTSLESCAVVVLIGGSILSSYGGCSQTTKPGCTNRCGNLTFAYPFGMNNTGNDCYFKESNSFFIFCDNSTGTPTPYMYARDCYNSSGGSLNNNDPWLILPDFPISSAKNKFIAVGCDTYATFSGSTYVTGCLSSCGNISDVINGSCSGIGCCETSIPRDAYRYNISVTSYNNHVGIWEFNPCGYAFVAEDGFSFSKDNLSNMR
ncbi:wall-associated receptor kinase 5-like [Eucalyptus grandis]|uniref:wall-associated receptor kinase 5-like n=1 Tax=Eucalyptus grandis TaxID=71139 RepID=UPI00192F057D|nr:wall-associated receptor kinase 5-like [Eucalyptus grandis]